MSAVLLALLDVLCLRAGAKIELAADNVRLVAGSVVRRHYTMAELLVDSTYSHL